jgi:tripartite-type tricarboxylate transporter receptor subunit TctC
MMFDAITTQAESIKGGKVKAIATTGKKRSAVLPDVPTVDESGVPGYEATIWLGLLAPKGTPAAIVNRLNEGVSRIVSQPEVQQAWAKQGAVAMVMNPQEFDRYVKGDIQKWAKVIKSAHIKAD